MLYNSLELFWRQTASRSTHSWPRWGKGRLAHLRATGRAKLAAGTSKRTTAHFSLDTPTAIW